MHLPRSPSFLAGHVGRPAFTWAWGGCGGHGGQACRGFSAGGRVCAGLVLAVGLVLLASPLRWKPLPCQRVLIRCCGFFGKIHLILLAFCKWHYIPFAVLCEQHHVYLFSSVAQSCLTLCDPMDCSPPGFSIHGIFQARVLEWGAIAFSKQYAWKIQIPFKDSRDI